MTPPRGGSHTAVTEAHPWKSSSSRSCPRPASPRATPAARSRRSPTSSRPSSPPLAGQVDAALGSAGGALGNVDLGNIGSSIGGLFGKK
ncbi:hypothetical protein [Nannocystis pusilla]|uniref:hypothetical protein n=1 Tax=Nannocystis pusilla TaxID=889268 RepID=UPI003B7A5790